jgi:hypothetical protein
MYVLGSHLALDVVGIQPRGHCLARTVHYPCLSSCIGRHRSAACSMSLFLSVRQSVCHSVVFLFHVLLLLLLLSAGLRATWMQRTDLILSFMFSCIAFLKQGVILCAIAPISGTPGCQLFPPPSSSPSPPPPPS